MTILSRPIRLGTRGSPLALVQARMVAERLRAAHGLGEEGIEIVPLRTTGDRVQDRPLAEIGGKALWTKELDQALHEGRIDCAVHSMKDVETIRPATLRIAAMLPRADVRDRLVGAPTLDALAAGARIGTSSPRRAAQLRHRRPDLRVMPFRGNVDTRLAKLAAGEAEATLLAAAGLIRLGRDSVGVPLAIEAMLPAPAQGAVGVECRADDAALAARLAAIDDDDTHVCVAAERALLAALGADCRAPVAALAQVTGARELTLVAQLLSEDGALTCQGVRALPRDTPGAAAALAHALLADAPPALARLFTPPR
ncbi:hydroxymethylbilane synthase [Sphingomonas morindae]|uniref:Porphobilinogen deaminase n=1 Tax=Sphingomonas morindae TaxID=1541170 RepID=A0ABY4XBM0_9SPHN|nr:hydroxymethylbilane synthase [Sphingomonas morindae]USI74280.1 hydroxymethylbilane synthase [Sphingomonas morindae]